MTIDDRQDIEDPAAEADMRAERLARRVAALYAGDPQFAAAKPDPAVIEAARGPGVRLAEVLQTLVDGYADRPALGLRAREFVTDSAAGRTSARLLPRFETISYRDFSARVSAIASPWRQDTPHPLTPPHPISPLPSPRPPTPPA